MVLLLFQVLFPGPSIAQATPEFSPSQELSWSDDFEDGNFDDWLTYGGRAGEEKLPGNFTIIDGALFAQGPLWNYAFQDSEVVTGTWSLDIYLVDRGNEVLVSFIVENHTLDGYWKNSYIIEFYTGPDRHGTEDGIAFLVMISHDPPQDYAWFQYSHPSAS